MKIYEVRELCEARVVCGSDRTGDEVISAFSSDLMSDVLMLPAEKLLLITGLCNIQTIRTAEIAEIRCILFVRNKKATEEMKLLAHEHGMVILETPFSLFKTSGLLFAGGLKPVY
jgi:hypothetical protein